jgi:hypothetical protein
VATAVGDGIWWLVRCHHPRPLGLLPPSTDENGNRLAAQWFCGHCGKKFPARFEHDHAPIQRFEGFDPIKAQNSARRAADFEQRTRKLAVKRSGIKKRQTPAPTPAPAVSPVNRPQPLPGPGRRLAS